MINELVQRLSEVKHGVVIGHRDESYEEIKQRIEDGYIGPVLRTRAFGTL